MIASPPSSQNWIPFSTKIKCGVSFYQFNIWHKITHEIENGTSKRLGTTNSKSAKDGKPMAFSGCRKSNAKHFLVLKRKTISFAVHKNKKNNIFFFFQLVWWANEKTLSTSQIILIILLYRCTALLCLLLGTAHCAHYAERKLLSWPKPA